MRIEIKSVHYHDEPETILYRYPELKSYNPYVRFLDENNIRGSVAIEVESVADLMCLSEKNRHRHYCRFNRTLLAFVRRLYRMNKKEKTRI